MKIYSQPRYVMRRYPVNFLKLKELFIELGYSKIIKLDERHSIFGQGNLYSAAISLND